VAESKIEWTEKTWNPTTGCDKISQGCKFCYAEVMARRLKAMGSEKYKNGFKLALHEDALKIPYTWKQPKIVFVNSMSDLFHEKIPFEFIDKVFAVMYLADRHIFQVLTKRPERMLEYFTDPKTPIRISSEVMSLDQWYDIKLPLKNVWLGVSVEDQKTADERIPLLLQTPAEIRWISAEPLLGGINIELNKLDWVVVGGESGSKARPMHPDWARKIRDNCKNAGVPFFFKQWGEYIAFNQMPKQEQLKLRRGEINHKIEKFISEPDNFIYHKLGKKRTGNLLDGKQYQEYPKLMEIWLNDRRTYKSKNEI